MASFAGAQDFLTNPTRRGTGTFLREVIVARREEVLGSIAPEVRAACPLTAQQVAAVYRMNIQEVVDACMLFVASHGTKGLRCYRSGRTWRIRPANVEAWLFAREEETARCDRII